MNKLMSVLLVLVLCVTGGSTLTGCNPSVQGLVVTENTNVVDSSPNATVAVPISQFTGTVGNAVKAAFANRNTTPVITTQPNLKGNTGAVVIPLDLNAAKTSFSSSPDILGFLESIAASLPLPFSPWINLAIGALYLLHPNVRGGVTSAVSRLVPGVADPAGNTGLPGVSDVQGAIMDLARGAVMAKPVVTH
jgi:hypothetical protein